MLGGIEGLRNYIRRFEPPTDNYQGLVSTDNKLDVEEDITTLQQRRTSSTGPSSDFVQRSVVPVNLPFLSCDS